MLSVAMLAPASHAQGASEHKSCTTITKPIEGNPGGTRTETRCDSSERQAAAASQASEATRAALTYFFVLRPELQAAYRERLNRDEAQFTSVYQALNVLSANEVPLSTRSAAELHRVKGYVLGESWKSFVDSSPNLKRRVDGCAAEKRPDPSKRQKKIVFNPCDDLWRMSDEPDAKMTLDCLEASMGAGRDMVCQDFDGEIRFEGGRLVSLKVVISHDWKDVLPDVIEKFGPPDAQSDAGDISIWNNARYHVVATSIEQGAALVWTTPELYQKAVEDGRSLLQGHKQEEGNSLDR